LNKNYKKKDITKYLSLKTGISNDYSKKITDDIFEIISEKIKKGYFNLKNIGSFKILAKKERIGRNPKTKEEFIITPRNTVSFTASKFLKKIVNKTL